MIEQAILAGKIAKKVREKSKNWIRLNTKITDLADRIEEMIINEGGGIAFPVNISINEIAAHDTARVKDERILKKGDLVKIDIGVHIEGIIADTAYTKEVETNNHKRLINATEEAVEKATKIIRPGLEIGEVGVIVQEVADKYGFSIVKNLVGHGLEPYEVHARINIPNYKTGSKHRLEKDELIAIEPYMTYGEGMAINSKKSQIFSLQNIKPVRNLKAKKIMDWIIKERKTLPFSMRWVVKRFGSGSELALQLLLRQGILKNYSVLKERSNKKVSQTEHTIIVQQPPIITTK